MANQSCSSSIISTTTTTSSNPWKKFSEPQAALVMDSVMDASSWPALSIQSVPSPEVILSTASAIVEIETCESIPTDMAAANDNESSSSSTIDNSAPRSEHTVVVSMSSSSSSSSSSSMAPRPRQYSYAHNQNHQHYSSGRFGTNQRGSGFNSKGGKRDQNFSNRRYQQRGFSNWNHNRGGFNSNANNRFINSQQIHGGSSGFFGPPPPPFPQSFPHSTPMVNPPYMNVNPQPPQAPIPGYMLPHFGYYGNAYFSEASNPLYCPPVPPLPPVPSPPPYVDAVGGALTYNQPIFPNSEVELCNRILHQIEYYFSKENLVKDGYMKSLMDDQGWVPVHLIAEFRRVKAMTSDRNVIVRSLQPSAVVEVQGDKMRKRGDWMNWVQNRSTDARISSVTDISTGIENIHLREKAGADALVADDSNSLHA
ncbi:la-related protein 1B-like [Macadamia integrifolia]|uniref:la-related protein 1B-like n=1 Tax=Macadamia integrifolia TaxID=60698 RepID=UPI001C4FC4D7|nr:la-related protein 1B-like [Macadamia integrifolia]